jgi:branched-chain amino acid transport system permease protein
MVGRPVFAVVMITLGLEIIVRTGSVAYWNPDNKSVGDPWGNSAHRLGDIALSDARLAAIGATAVVLTLFFLFFRFTRTGLAMRAAALDQEVAMAMGISVRRVFAVSWGIAAALATLAGVFVATAAGGAGTLEPFNAFIALRAFPAAILGGLDSPGGAVLGGVVIGLVEVLAGGYSQEIDFLGQGFNNVAPYVVMIAVLLVRPWGLFGTREIERV